MLGDYNTLFGQLPCRENKKNMNITYKILGALTIIIVVAAVLSYVYLSNPTLGQQTTNNPTPTPTPTASPTATPTATPTSHPTTTPTVHPTATPTTAPTATPTPSPTPTPDPVSLTGAGATFPYPLINAMITDYGTNHPWVSINYQSIGSGGGIAAMQAKTVDFGASDAPLTASDAANVPNALHIPETIGAVTVAYNLPGIPTGLHLTGDVIAKIYLGTITKWNDAAIQTLNPGTTLPDKDIVTVHRSDGSGTTFVFTGYLSAVSSTWSTAVGQGKSVAWPVAGLANAGNSGVAGAVEGTAYTIGYVELAYAVENSMKVAAIQNPAGSYVMPTLASTTAAAQSMASAGLPAGSASWTSVNILNAPGSTSYPIVSFSYIVVYKELNVIPSLTQAEATALVQWLWYMVHDGQNRASALSYAPLPANVVSIDEATIRSITFNGQTVYTS
jgi:phosphate transport system substrate-binding protein